MAGSALSFAGGNNGYVSAPYTFPTDAFSVFFWYKNTYTGFKEAWFSQTGSFSLVRQDVNDIQLYAYLNASADFAGLRRLLVGRNLADAKTDGIWHSRVYAVYINGTNHGSCDEYEDGVFLKTDSTSYTGDTATPSGDLFIGRSIGDARVSPGQMDRVAIVNRKATAAEALAFHNGTAPVSLGALWNMDEGTGTTVRDSANGNNGVFAGSGIAPVWVTPGVSTQSADIPIANIRHQSFTTQPFTPDATLVDDPVALVDDPTALVGGQISIIPGGKVNLINPRYFPIIRKRR